MNAPVPFAPPTGHDVPPRTLLATWDADTVVVWQAHGTEVAERAVATGRFDGPAWRHDRTTRMRVSLPSLAWRTAYGQRAGRERLLAVRLRRAGFDELLRRAVEAEDDRAVYPSTATWRLAMRYASATVSWHPDRGPDGAELPWQTPRFGLRGALLDAFSREWVVGVEDHTGWLADRSLTPVVAPYAPGGSGVR